MSPQDKIMHVASKLGLSTLKDMQGSTGAIYDCDTDGSGQLFAAASRHAKPGVTNLTDNKFEVNEALLIETIGFFAYNTSTRNVYNLINSGNNQNVVVLWDLVIGNKVVMKNTPVFLSGTPGTFATWATQNGQNVSPPLPNTNISGLLPRHQVFLEGAGILIPPQVEFSIEYKLYNMTTGATQALNANNVLGAYLFGTRVLLNFNTSI